MRAPKFRIWDKKHQAYLREGGEYLTNSHIFCSPHETVSDYEIEQFTGMFDKNGNEIWAGDLVKYYEGRRIDIAPVTYSDYCGFWFANNCAGRRFEGSEVIGNIRETPELLREHELYCAYGGG